MKWYLKVLKQYADFKGRAQRIEFWMFSLFYTLILSLLIFLVSNSPSSSGDTIRSTLFFLCILIHIIPSIAVTVRRLHDIGMNGWMILIGLIPIIGSIWLFVLMVTDSNPGENEYGPNPKEVTV